MSKKIIGVTVGTTMNPNRFGGGGATSWENVTNKPDTFPPSVHSHTAAEVGAAPSGFGLGETQGKVITDCNTAILTGFYACSSGTTNTPNADAFKYAALFVECRGTTLYQTITYLGLSAKRYAKPDDNGATWTFYPWEWINPPLTAGVEYRTTERYKGNPVYIKMVNFGTMPNTTAKSVSIGTNFNVISIEGKTTNGNYMIPLSIHNGINSVYYNKSDGKLNVETKTDASKWSAEIVVKYTK